MKQQRKRTTIKNKKYDPMNYSPWCYTPDTDNAFLQGLADLYDQYQAGAARGSAAIGAYVNHGARKLA